MNGVKGTQGPSGPTGDAGPAGAFGPDAQNFTDNRTIFLSNVKYPAGLPYAFFSPSAQSTTVSGNGNPNAPGSFVTVPVACTLTVLNVGADTLPAGLPYLANVLRNGAFTPLFCTLPGSSTTSGCTDSDPTHAVAVNAGDTLSVLFQRSNVQPVIAPLDLATRLICQ